MKKLLLSAILFLAAMATYAQDRPKLIVGIMVDQMRWDYLHRYYNLYGDGGFKRMMNEGFDCENTMINYIPAITAVGHTSVYTGSVPSIHGIQANNFLLDGKKTYCTADNSVQGVGTKSKSGQMSPHNLLTTTIGDELKVATDFKSRVIGISIKDRAAILPAGHAADAAYWIDSDQSRFVSSTYYMKQLPAWVEKYNKTVSKYTSDQISYSPAGNEVTIEMAKNAITNEKLGQQGETDMICISFSSTDKIGHKYGTHNQIIQTQFVDLDRRLADFFSYLDQTIGKGEYLVFLAADHGAANNILMNQEHGIPSGPFFYRKELTALNDYLKTKYSVTADLASAIMSYCVVLNHDAISNAGLELDKVKADVTDYFQTKEYIAYAVDMDKAATATVPSYIKEKMINGYCRQRNGDIQLIVKPGWYEVYGDKVDGGTTHGVWNPYDAHIPFLMMGWGVKHGKTNHRTYITDIAPTICNLVHIQMPNGCIGNAVEMK